MKHFRQSILTLAILTTIFSCSTDTQDNETENPLTADNIETTRFSINADQDTTVVCPQGTVLRIYQNTFVDASGNSPTGQVDIEVKEVLTNEDIVLANFYTLSNGQLLESGGMIYVNATASNEQLTIADGQSIGIIIQPDNRMENMQVFSGEVDTSNGQVNWIEPNAILENDFISLTDSADEVVGDSVIGEVIGSEIVEFLDVAADTIEIAINQNLNPEELARIQEEQDRFWKEWNSQADNTFLEDPTVCYAFKISKLGWANIDRLYDDPRSKEIDFATKIDNHSDFGIIYISMIFEYRSIYLPGYKTKQETYSFTHGDYEKTKLPVGETAIIIATAYKDNVPYIGIKDCKIEDNKTVEFALTETTKEKMAELIKEKI